MSRKALIFLPGKEVRMVKLIMKIVDYLLGGNLDRLADVVTGRE